MDFLKRWRHEIETCELFVVIKMKRQKKLVLKSNLTLEKKIESGYFFAKIKVVTELTLFFALLFGSSMERVSSSLTLMYSNLI